MNIDPYVEGIRRQLEVAGEAGGDETRAVAERLAAPLDSAVRLGILEALSAATEEITVEMAPGSVEVRLRGREPEFVVSLPPADRPGEIEDEQESAPPSTWRAGDAGDATVSRINLRMPDRLKSKIEQAAGAEGLSVNAWLVRAAAAGLERTEPARTRDRRTPQGSQRYTGWAR
ncbi:MAG TPA: hypothetical protein VK646_04190 [Actinomycetota bacterium]|nr:hypothetical protein [Actinomycetota bacterium]